MRSRPGRLPASGRRSPGYLRAECRRPVAAARPCARPRSAAHARCPSTDGSAARAPRSPRALAAVHRSPDGAANSTPGSGWPTGGYLRAAPAAAVVVDKLRDLLLADAALAGDEPGRVGRSDPPGQVGGTAERRGYSDQRDLVGATALGAAARLEVARLARHYDGVRRAPQQDLEMRRGEGLGEVVPRPRLERLDVRGDRRMAGHDDHDGFRMVLERDP